MPAIFSDKNRSRCRFSCRKRLLLEERMIPVKTPLFLRMLNMEA